MGTGVEIPIMIAAISTAAKMSSEYDAAESRQDALDLQGKQLQLQNQQKTLGNLDVMEKVLDAQAAALTTRGVAFSSPSFNAIQRQTLNIGARQGRNLDIEERLNEENTEAEKENVRNTLHAQLFGDVANFAFTVAGVQSKLPAKSSPSILPQMES